MSEFSKAALFIGWTVAMIMIGASMQWQSDRKAAIKAGKAEYYLDENNEKKWRWK